MSATTTCDIILFFVPYFGQVTASVVSTVLIQYNSSYLTNQELNMGFQSTTKYLNFSYIVGD